MSAEGTFRPDLDDYFRRFIAAADVVRVHHGDPDAYAEAWNDGWNEAHAQGVGGQESREWVLRQLRGELAKPASIDEADDQLAGRLADAVLSKTDLSDPVADALAAAEDTDCPVCAVNGYAHRPDCPRPNTEPGADQ